MKGIADIFEKNREQEIITPDFILDEIRRLWGIIELDPCGSHKKIYAKKTYFEEDNGLSHQWREKTFVNPPYKYLKLWMEKMRKEMDGKRIAMLCPVRTHRYWWMDTAKKGTIVFLQRVVFDNYSSPIPIPMCIIFSNKKDAQDCKIGIKL